MFRGNLNRYTKRPLQDSAIIFSTPGWGNLRFTAQITGFPANVSNPQGGKSTDFSAGQCHLLYFVVVPESLNVLCQRVYTAYAELLQRAAGGTSQHWRQQRLYPGLSPKVRAGKKKPINRQTYKHFCSGNCPGIIPGLSGTPGISFMFFLLNFPRKRQHINNLDSHPFPGQFREVVYVYCVFLAKPGVLLRQGSWSTVGTPLQIYSNRFFCINFLNTPRGPGHPGKIPGTSQIPLFETQGRQTFEGGHEVFGHHPFELKTPTPPGGLRTHKVYLCALFSCLIRGSLLRGGYNNSLHVPLAVPSPAPTPHP